MRRPRTWIVALGGVAVIAGAVVALRARGPDDADARRELAALHQARDVTLGAGPSSLDETYAVALPGAVALQELLVAAGVPRFMEVADAAAVRALGAPGPRLVLAGRARADTARALCGAERVVVSVEDAAPARVARSARLGALTAPLADAPAVELTLTEGERALAVDEGGAPVAAIGPCAGGALLRLGVDLGARFMLMRQGDPRRGGADHDGNGELQPADMLPPAPDAPAMQPWADLFVDAMLDAVDGATPCPLPRVAPLPPGDGPVVVLTADQDYADDEVVRAMADRLEARGARATFLLTDPAHGLPADLNVRDGVAPELSDALGAALRAGGHGLGIHPFPRVAGDVREVARAFAARRGARPLIARNHHLRWSGHLEIPAIEAREGVAMNLDWMPVSRGGAPGVGFPGGSARPLRFVVDQRALPILQQPTLIDDYSLRVPDYALLAPAAAALARASEALIARARREGYGVVVNAHPILARFAPQWLDPVLGAPAARVLRAEDWLAFQLARRRGRIASTRCGEPLRTTLPDGVTLRPRGGA